MTHLVRVQFKNGDHIDTFINGTESEVRDYYRIGKVFNLGYGGDDLESAVVGLEVLE